MLTKIKKLFSPKTQTLNTITISKKNILHNVEYIRTLQPTSEIFPVMKSNAYGHGISQILNILKENKFPYIIVDSFPEYQIVRKQSKFL